MPRTDIPWWDLSNWTIVSSEAWELERNGYVLRVCLPRHGSTKCAWKIHGHGFLQQGGAADFGLARDKVVRVYKIRTGDQG